jgi:hypothetical protein
MCARPMDDGEWWAESERQYERHRRQFEPSPDDLADGAQWLYLDRKFGAAALMYQRAIDMLHSFYCAGDLPFVVRQMGERHPSASDSRITNGYLSALRASLAAHPRAPVKNSITEVVGRLADIVSVCKKSGLSPTLYVNALRELAPIAQPYGVEIDRRALEDDSRTTVFDQRDQRTIIADHGSIVALDHSSVTGSRATSVSAQGPPEQAMALLQQFVGILHQTEDADQAYLAAKAEDMHVELVKPAPARDRSKLKSLAAKIAAATKGAGALADLAIQIEKVIHGM